jgi:hypothetical protein
MMEVGINSPQGEVMSGRGGINIQNFKKVFGHMRTSSDKKSDEKQGPSTPKATETREKSRVTWGRHDQVQLTPRSVGANAESKDTSPPMSSSSPPKRTPPPPAWPKSQEEIDAEYAKLIEGIDHFFEDSGAQSSEKDIQEPTSTQPGLITLEAPETDQPRITTQEVSSPPPSITTTTSPTATAVAAPAPRLDWPPGFNKPLGHARTQSDKPGQEDQPAPRAEKVKRQAKAGHTRAQSTGWGVVPTPKKEEAKKKFANLTGKAGVLMRRPKIEVASYETTEIRDNPDAEKKVSVRERIRQFERETEAQAQPSIISTGKAPEPAPSITTTTTTTTTTSSAPKKPLPPLPTPRPEDRPTAGETPMSPRRDAGLPSLNTSKSEKPS